MKVSVIVPTYNSQKYVTQCLNSIKNQTYGNMEVIVVDNESTDGTMSIIKEYCNKYKWKIGSAPNLYKYSWYEPTRMAMNMMDDDSEWFTIVASDDCLEKDYIKNCVKVADTMEKAGVPVEAFQTPIKGFGGRNEIQAYQYGCTVEDYFEQLKKRCVVNTPTVFWRADLIDRGMMKSHPEKFGGAEDYWMYLNQASQGLLIYPYPNWIGYNYRWNEDQATWGMIKNMPHADKMIKDEWNDNN